MYSAPIVVINEVKKKRRRRGTLAMPDGTVSLSGVAAVALGAYLANRVAEVRRCSLWLSFNVGRIAPAVSSGVTALGSADCPMLLSYMKALLECSP
jgi:hypothetical protein